MQIIKTPSYKELSLAAAEIVIKTLAAKSDLVLGLATGSTPLGLYEILKGKYLKKEADFSKVKTFNLDEYYGLERASCQCYRNFMQEHFFSGVNIQKENIEFLKTDAEDPEAECRRYEEEIKKAGGIDLQILGLGHNGHIAFNEPGSLKNSRTRLIKLDQKTRQDNARFFDSLQEVPQYALTMGIATILETKKAILLAGREKREIIEKAINSGPDPEIPATFLKLHPDCTWIVES